VPCRAKMQLTWTSVNPLDVSGPDKVSHNVSKATSPFLSTATARNGLRHQASRRSHISTPNHCSAPDFISSVEPWENSPFAFDRDHVVHLLRFQRCFQEIFSHPLYSHQPSHSLTSEASYVFSIFFPLPSSKVTPFSSFALLHVAKHAKQYHLLQWPW